MVGDLHGFVIGMSKKLLHGLDSHAKAVEVSQKLT
jgi:hypothetical protein